VKKETQKIECRAGASVLEEPKPRFNIYEPSGEFTNKVLQICLMGKKTKKEIWEYAKKMEGLHKEKRPKGRNIPAKSIVVKRPTGKTYYSEEPAYKVKFKGEAVSLSTVGSVLSELEKQGFIKSKKIEGQREKIFSVNYAKLLEQLAEFSLWFGLPFKEFDFKFRVYKTLPKTKRILHKIVSLRNAIVNVLSGLTDREKIYLAGESIPEGALRIYLEYFLFGQYIEKAFTKKQIEHFTQQTRTFRRVILWAFPYFLARTRSTVLPKKLQNYRKRVKCMETAIEKHIELSDLPISEAIEESKKYANYLKSEYDACVYEKWKGIKIKKKTYETYLNSESRFWAGIVEEVKLKVKPKISAEQSKGILKVVEEKANEIFPSVFKEYQALIKANR